MNIAMKTYNQYKLLLERQGDFNLDGETKWLSLDTDAKHNTDLHKRNQPSGLTLDELSTIKTYAISSQPFNNYLRDTSHQSDSALLHHIKTLQSVFRPETTNKDSITLYSGIPQHIGSILESGHTGQIHILPAFTSTSSQKKVAHLFSHSRKIIDPQSGKLKLQRHIIQLTAKPGSALSLRGYSTHPNEFEFLLNSGSKIKYIKTERHKPNIHVHHVELVD